MALSDLDMVTVWSAGRQVHPAARGAALLRAVSPGATLEELARLPIGRRDARLLALRERWFGPRLVAVTACPACAVRVEAEVPVAMLMREEDALEIPSHIVIGGRRVPIRPPDTRDLVAIAAADGEESARAMLLQRCVAGTDLPAEAEADVVAAIAALDPHADVTVALICPECGHRWESTLDIAAFLWSEIDAAARRALRDVHTLAAAYGWSEDEILAIPPPRRQLYLDMVSG